MDKVARTYRKSHPVVKSESRGSHHPDGLGNMNSRGTSTTKLSYKPKAMGMTYGTSSPKGGGTKRVKRAKG